jgi:MATE family multidrug resistance protein
MIWYIYSHSRFKVQRAKLFRFNYKRSVLRKLISIGVPSGMQYIFEVTAFSVAAIFAGMLGAEALAAHQIAINMASVSYMAATGLGAAATIRVGTEFGKGHYLLLKDGARSIFVMTVIWMVAAGLLILTFRYTLAGFYTTEQGVISIAASMLLVVVLFQISDGLQAVCLGALRGFTDVKIPTLITFVAYWLLSVPVSYYLSQYTSLGVMGIWYSLAGALTLSAILLLSRFYNLLEKFRQRSLLKGAGRIRSTY